MTTLAVLVAADEWPKRATVGGVEYRSMLPAGFHCGRCHGLVSVEEANMGMEVPTFRALFDAATVLVILAAHSTTTCPRVASTAPGAA